LKRVLSSVTRAVLSSLTRRHSITTQSEGFHSMPVTLLPLTQKLTIADIVAHARSRSDCPEKILVADTYVENSEQWTALPGGWQTEVDGLTIINVDHHAPVPRMQRPISSGNLAIDYVRAHGVASDALVLINHCDCDSIVSSSILAGEVPPDDNLSQAVIAADHSGTENHIADHLQPLEALRDLVLSQQTLRQLVAGESVVDTVRELWQQRVSERHQWQEKIDQPGMIDWTDKVALIESAERIPAELLTGLLPQADLILTAYPASSPAQVPPSETKWILKIRLGQAAADRFTLESLAVRILDPAFGGRWNAGSNNRGGGTTIPPKRYASLLAENIAAL